VAARRKGENPIVWWPDKKADVRGDRGWKSLEDFLADAEVDGGRGEEYTIKV